MAVQDCPHKDWVDKSMENLEKRMDKFEKRMDKFDEKLDKLSCDVGEISRQLSVLVQEFRTKQSNKSIFVTIGIACITLSLSLGVWITSEINSLKQNQAIYLGK